MNKDVSRARPLLDYIAKYESGGDYNIVWGGIKKADHPPKPLTQLTIGEVLNWQDSIDRKYMSEAAGRYQIMEDTLRGLYRSAGFSEHSPYHEWTQDELALALLRRRGWDDYIAGRISAEKFCNSLAREWASLPVVTGPKKGRSYYAGDGLNAAHAKVPDFLAVVKSCIEPMHPIDEPLTPPDPEPKVSPWGRLLTAILSIFNK